MPTTDPADARGSSAIDVEGLTKIYPGKPPHTALDHADLRVPPGAVYGVLGPNGAGKTTLVRILATLLKPTKGRARVAGLDVVERPDEVRARIGLLGQNTAVDEELSGRENLELFGRLHHLGGRGARRRGRELLDRFDLADAGDRPVKKYSGGMRRRLDLAATLVMSPDVLFLDEPTTGLDPRGRTEVWSAVRSLTAGGTTIVLTTQYLEEADQLAERICVLDHGRVVADDTTDRLKAELGTDRIEVVVHDAGDLDAAGELLRRATGSDELTVDADRRLLSCPAADRMAALTLTVRELTEAGLRADDIAIRRPTLDEVFLHVTGAPAESSGPSDPTPDPTTGRRGTDSTNAREVSA